MGVSRRGNVWYVRWKDAAGVWRRRRTTGRTKKEAQDLFAELVNHADRQRQGLEARPLKLGMDFGGLCSWWLNKHCRKASVRRMKSTFDVHVQRTHLGKLSLGVVTADPFNAYFEWMEKQEYKPRSINQLRRRLSAVFTMAKMDSLWAGENPIRKTSAREVDHSPRPVLKPAEVPLILEAVPKQWSGFFAAGVYLGLRKGELCGLLKADYDQVHRTLYIGRSYGATTTKGKRIDRLPVTDRLAPYLDAALKTPGAYLFPGPRGKMRNENVGCEDILKVAMKRVGLIEGWLHKCRRCVRKKVKHEHLLTDSDEPVRCPRCNFMLWPVAIPRAMRFHDLRHTAATHLLQAGVPVQHVQRILRHASITTTIGTYGHLLTEDLRPALEKLGPQPAQTAGLRRVT